MYNNLSCVWLMHPHVMGAISYRTATLNMYSPHLRKDPVIYREGLTSKLVAGNDCGFINFVGA